MTFIFDLDNTILNTQELKRLIFKSMESAGAAIGDISDTYQKVSQDEDLYNPQSHLDLLSKQIPNLNKAAALNGITGIDYKALLLPDAEKIVTEAKKSGKTILLTRGNYSFQAKKVLKTGISDWFDDVVITTQNKDEAIKSLQIDGEVYVFNDKIAENEAMKKVMPGWIFIDIKDIKKDWESIKNNLQK